MVSAHGAFPVESCLIAFLTSSSLGGLSRSVFVSTYCRREKDSALISGGLLSTPLKCSAHLFRMAVLSVISVVPSTLGKGDVLDYCGSLTASGHHRSTLSHECQLISEFHLLCQRATSLASCVDWFVLSCEC